MQKEDGTELCPPVRGTRCQMPLAPTGMTRQVRWRT